MARITILASLRNNAFGASRKIPSIAVKQLKRLNSQVLSVFRLEIGQVWARKNVLSRTGIRRTQGNKGAIRPVEVG